MPLSNEEDTWTTPVFEVVSVVLERDDVFIFADAIIDCVMCLQKFICSGSVQQSKDTVHVVSEMYITVYSEHFTLYNVHCTMYTVHVVGGKFT